MTLRLSLLAALLVGATSASHGTVVFSDNSALMLAGLAALGLVARRRRRAH